MQVSDQLHAPAALPPVPIGEEAGWDPEPSQPEVTSEEDVNSRVDVHQERET
jgi:hypothetical protein